MKNLEQNLTNSNTLTLSFEEHGKINNEECLNILFQHATQVNMNLLKLVMI